MTARAATPREAASAMSDSAPRHPLFVELVGLPGAGKTTVASLLPARLAESGASCAVADVSPRAAPARAVYYARAAWFCATHPRLVGAAVRYALAVRPLRLHSLARLRVLLAASFQLRVRRPPCDIVVAHQGALQELWSLSVHGRFPAPRHLRSVLRQLYADCRGRLAFVLLDIDAMDAVDRMHRRADAGSRFQQLPPDSAAALLDTLQDRLQLLVHSAASVARSPALRVDAAESPSAVCEHIVAFARSLPSPTQRPQWSAALSDAAPHLVLPEVTP